MPSVPKIGMRLIKTAVAVFLCFLLDFFRDGGTPFLFGNCRNSLHAA